MAMANMNLIGVFVTKLWPVQALACGGGDGGATKTIISPKFSNFGDIITLDTMLKHPQIANLELCFQHKSAMNNIDGRITLVYQYAWLCVCQHKFCLLRAVTCK